MPQKNLRIVRTQNTLRLQTMNFCAEGADRMEVLEHALWTIEEHASEARRQTQILQTLVKLLLDAGIATCELLDGDSGVESETLAHVAWEAQERSWTASEVAREVVEAVKAGLFHERDDDAAGGAA